MMTLNFTSLTDQELAHLGDRVYRATCRLFDAASALHLQMAQTATTVPAYREMERSSQVLMAAGREQNELYSDILRVTRERRDRRAQAEVHKRIAAAVGNFADDDKWFAEAQLNERGK